MLSAIPTIIASGIVLVFSQMQPDAAQAKDSDCTKKTGDVRTKTTLTKIASYKRTWDRLAQITFSANLA